MKRYIALSLLATCAFAQMQSATPDSLQWLLADYPDLKMRITLAGQQMQSARSHFIFGLGCNIAGTILMLVDINRDIENEAESTWGAAGYIGAGINVLGLISYVMAWENISAAGKRLE